MQIFLSPRDQFSAGSASSTRSLAKAVSYRLVVMCADAIAIYLLTGQWRIAVGFMIVSNVYTTLLYFLHERAWAHIRWGRRRLQPFESRGP